VKSEGRVIKVPFFKPAFEIQIDADGAECKSGKTAHPHKLQNCEVADAEWEAAQTARPKETEADRKQVGAGDNIGMGWGGVRPCAHKTQPMSA
jgi:hypothetical protein